MENNTIRIALTNLGKYNEGELVYTWLELPASDDEINEAFTKINVAPNTQYEEHFITDYEAPFEISEYESITRLNQLAEQLDMLDIPQSIFDGNYDVTDVINFAMELCNTGVVSNADEYVQDIVSDDLLDEMVQHEAESGGWQRVAYFLAGIKYMNDDYYRINGYGNAENLDSNYLDAIVSDLLDEMRREIRC